MKLTAGLHAEYLSFWRKKKPAVLFSTLFKKFRCILDRNIKIMELMADIGDKLSGEYIFDRQYIYTVTEELNNLLRKHISDLDDLEQHKNTDLFNSFERIHNRIREEISGKHSVSEIPFIRFPEELLTAPSRALDELGNENIIMSEIQNILRLPVPDGFFITTSVFSDFMKYNGLVPHISEYFGRLEKGDEKPDDTVSKGLCRINLNIYVKYAMLHAWRKLTDMRLKKSIMHCGIFLMKEPVGCGRLLKPGHCPMGERA